MAVAILNWNGQKHLEQFMPFVLQLEYPRYTVYLIDNGSTDGSVEFVKKQFPLVSHIDNGANLGFAEGYNRAFEKLTEPYILMMNSDVKPEKTMLHHLVRDLEGGKDIAVSQPRILSYSRPDYFEHAGAAGGFIDRLGYAFCRGRLFDFTEKDEGLWGDAYIFWASGACSLYRREDYMETGGLYPYFFMHFEEIDLCWRLQSAGKKIHYCSQAVAYHLGGGSLPYESTRKTFLNFRNNMIMLLRNEPAARLLYKFPFRLGLDALACFVFVLKGQGRHAMAVAKAYKDIIAWMFTAEKPLIRKKALKDIPTVTRKWMVWEYFVKGRKKFGDIFNDGSGISF